MKLKQAIVRFGRAVRRIWRSSVTGRFVSRDFAERNPNETTEERR